MWLIHRDTDGNSRDRIPLPVPLREALVRWYVGEGSFHDEQAGVTLVQNARIGQRWIACDCLGHDKAPPILTPAYLSEAETYYLRRLTSTKRPEHRAECPFFRDQATNRITEVRSQNTPTDPPSGFFEVLRPAPEKLSQRPDDDSLDDRTRNASTPRLARLLWRLLDNAGCNRIAPLSLGYEWSITETIRLATGLLLPIWSALPSDHLAVNRIADAQGNSWLGRLVFDKHVVQLYTKLGIAKTDDLPVDAIASSVLSGRAVDVVRPFPMTIRRAIVNGNQRVEIVDAPAAQLSWLKSLGCFTEIIAYKTRVFVPATDAEAILARVLKAA